MVTKKKKGGIHMQINLYNVRKEAQMSQEEVAEVLNISRISYGQKERSQKPFTLDEMFKLSELFKKSLDDIFLPRTNHFGYKELVKPWEV